MTRMTDLYPLLLLSLPSRFLALDVLKHACLSCMFFCRRLQLRQRRDASLALFLGAVTTARTWYTERMELAHKWPERYISTTCSNTPSRSHVRCFSVQKHSARYRSTFFSCVWYVWFLCVVLNWLYLAQSILPFYIYAVKTERAN